MSAQATQFSDAPDELLAVALDRTKRLIKALSMADLADMRIADIGSDRVLDRNFERTQAARRTLAKIEAEIERRASLSPAAVMSTSPGDHQNHIGPAFSASSGTDTARVEDLK